MSSEIYYEKAFISIGDRFIPLVCRGSTNTFEFNVHGCEVAERYWSVLDLPYRGRLLFTSDEIQKIAETYYEVVPKEQRKGKVQINVSTSFFVPKPFTPFQWAPMIRPEEFVKRAYFVKDRFREEKNHKSLKFQYHEADITILEGLLARGDRKLCDVIYDVYRSGQIYDAWTEFFKKENWDNSMAKHGLDIDFYTYRDRNVDEILPWDFIDIGVTRGFLEREWENAQNEKVTPNCRQQCSGCGAARFGGGVCFENKN